MEQQLSLTILPQPDDTTCGPTCLHSIYEYYHDPLPLSQIIAEVPTLVEGGTLTSLLGAHALGRGYSAQMYSYDLNMFDPTWYGLSSAQLQQKLQARMEFKADSKFTVATRANMDFLDLGGKFIFEDLTPELIRRFLSRNIPIITELSATYLYRSAREFGYDMIFDDVRGEPSGHFVVMSGYSRPGKTVHISDPLIPNFYAPSTPYAVPISRLICAILLGVQTYGGTLLIIQPKPEQGKTHARTHRSE